MTLLMDTHAFLWLVEGHIKPLFSKPRMTRSIPFAISTEFLTDPYFLTIPCSGIESGNEHYFQNHVEESDNDPQSCRSGFADQTVLAADV